MRVVGNREASALYSVEVIDLARQSRSRGAEYSGWDVGWSEGRALPHCLLPGEPKHRSFTSKHGSLRLSRPNTSQLQLWVHPILALTG